MDTDDQAEHSLKNGDVVAGKYRVEREIGRGGMGVVVAAVHMDLDQLVAIKVLQKSAAYNQDALARFMREARAAAKIRSDHVARVMDVGKLEDGLTYIVMEYLEGGDLADVLKKEGSLGITRAVDYVLQACEGIAAAHAAGIIHRDIKPANLFLAHQPGRTQLVKILDFGVSKISQKDAEGDDATATQSGQVFGSPLYMSPEQLDSTVGIDCRTDIWALGVVLFELLTGKPPFGGKSSANIMTAVIRDPAPKLQTLLPEAPAELNEVIARCLEKDRELRYANALEFAAAIAPFGGKGAEDAIDRIREILAHPVKYFRNSIPDTTTSDEHISDKGASSGSSSDRRRSGAGRDSADPSLGGAARTHGGSRTSSKRRALVMGIAVVAALGIAAVVIDRPNTVKPANAPSAPAAVAESIPASSPSRSMTPLVAHADIKPPSVNDVTITFTGAPNDTKVFRGDAEIGRTTTPLRLPRSNEKVTLRFVADTFAPVEMELLPDVDQTLTITLKPAKPSATTPSKRKVPKELEPF